MSIVQITALIVLIAIIVLRRKLFGIFVYAGIAVIALCCLPVWLIYGFFKGFILYFIDVDTRNTVDANLRAMNRTLHNAVSLALLPLHNKAVRNALTCNYPFVVRREKAIKAWYAHSTFNPTTRYTVFRPFRSYVRALADIWTYGKTHSNQLARSLRTGMILSRFMRYL